MKLIYTDYCSVEAERNIKQQLNVDIVKRIDPKNWTVNETMRIITDPDITLAVFNVINDISLIELGLLNFLCKDILITSRIYDYNSVCKKITTYYDPELTLLETADNFIYWYQNKVK